MLIAREFELGTLAVRPLFSSLGSSQSTTKAALGLTWLKADDRSKMLTQELMSALLLDKMLTAE
jgi:hypothetical protein